MVYFAKWKIVFILVVCVLGFAFSTPNFLNQKTTESLPTWLPHKQVSLGLDLQGGSHLLLEVDVNTVIKEQLESLVDSMRVGACAPNRDSKPQPQPQSQPLTPSPTPTISKT